MTDAKDETAVAIVRDRSLLRRAADWSVRIALPIGVVAVVLAVFLGERTSIDHSLSIVVPENVEPEVPVPVRAFVFGAIDSMEGPRLAPVPVVVHVIDRRGAVRARIPLRPSVAGGSEGEVRIPPELTGWIGVRAVARSHGEIVATSETSIHVRRDPPAIELVPRVGRALSRFSLGEIEPLAGGAPSPFDVRVAGGSCVPESRCEILVHVGEPPAAVAISPDRAITVLPVEEAETSSVVALPIVVHGPEARVELVASRGGVAVARRELVVPVALATPALAISPRVTTSRPRLHVEVLGDRPGVVVDAYRDGRWRHTGSFRPSDRAVVLPFELEPGVWRLQVHTDPFAAERSAVRTVAVHAPGTSSDQVIRELGDGPGGPEERLAWLSARAEDAIAPLPAPVSGYTDDLERVEARQRVLRSAAGAALLLGVLIAAILFLRRGVDAAQVAQRVMAATGDPELLGSRHRRRTLLSALAIVATVLLAFVGAAALVAARAHLFE